VDKKVFVSKKYRKNNIISFIYYLIILRSERDIYLKALSFDENGIVFKFRRNRFLVYFDCLIFDVILIKFFEQKFE